MFIAGIFISVIFIVAVIIIAALNTTIASMDIVAGIILMATKEYPNIPTDQSQILL